MTEDALITNNYHAGAGAGGQSTAVRCSAGGCQLLSDLTFYANTSILILHQKLAGFIFGNIIILRQAAP